MAKWLLKEKIRRDRMNKKSLLIALIYSLSWIITLTGQEGSESPIKIGVVNIKKVFDDSLEAKEVKSTLEKEQKAVEKKLTELEKKMKELQEEIKQLEESGAGEYTLSDKRRELATLKSTYDFERQEFAQKLRDKVNRFTLDLYNKFRNVIEEYAIKNKFTLVFKVEDKELNYEPNYPTDERIRPRTLLYYKNELDITQHIIDEVNRKYLEEKSQSKK